MSKILFAIIVFRPVASAPCHGALLGNWFPLFVNWSLQLFHLACPSNEERGEIAVLQPARNSVVTC